MSIPFNKSFFAGGSIDNRAWEVYRLGPGISGASNEFNEANMKIAFNIEYRFKILGKLDGAIFNDFGNIWNVFDDTEDSKKIMFLKQEEIISNFSGNVCSE